MGVTHHGRTERLDLADPTLREWQCTVLHADPDGIVLDRSAFYPGGGGQPPDRGVLSGPTAASACGSPRRQGAAPS